MKPDPGGPDLTDFTPAGRFWPVFQGDGNLQVILVSVLSDLVCQSRLLPVLVRDPRTARELVAFRVKSAAEFDRPRLVLDQLDDDPIARLQVDILLEESCPR